MGAGDHTSVAITPSFCGNPSDMSTTVADTLAPLIREMVNDEIPVKIACWDGSRAGPSAARWQLNISKRGLRRLLWAPNEVGLARAYVSGDIDIDGDVLAYGSPPGTTDRIGKSEPVEGNEMVVPPLVVHPQTVAGQLICSAI